MMHLQLKHGSESKKNAFTVWKDRTVMETILRKKRMLEQRVMEDEI